GFNNDWDLTAALVRYLLSRLPRLPSPATAHAGGASLWASLAGLGAGAPPPALHGGIPEFAAQLTAGGGGLAAAGRLLANAPNQALAFDQGDPCQANVVQRMFQELYLGPALFTRTYGHAPLWHREDGFMERESLIPTSATLEALARRMPLAVATGRPRAEAVWALERFGLTPLFQAVITLDDVQAAEALHPGGLPLGKPHPFSLVEAARQAGHAFGPCVYVGDTPDDMRAARRAVAPPFWAVGCTAVAANAKEADQALRQAGADLVVAHPNDLAAVAWGPLASRRSPDSVGRPANQD
ncbi:MAG: HAD family hydrolase, partial [Chloroflexi bacterium]|nr:HAD family hydrolase [Chloroflexota bacterium]